MYIQYVSSNYLAHIDIHIIYKDKMIILGIPKKFIPSYTNKIKYSLVKSSSNIGC